MIFKIEDHQNAQNFEPNPMVIVAWPGDTIFVPYIITILYRGGTYFPPTVLPRMAPKVVASKPKSRLLAPLPDECWLRVFTHLEAAC